MTATVQAIRRRAALGILTPAPKGRPPRASPMRFPRLLAPALLLAAPLAHAQPALVDFVAPVPQALAVTPGGAEPLNPTLAALLADPNVSDLRVGHADPQAVVSARAFRLDPTAGPGDTIAVSSLAVIPSGGGDVVFLLGEGADLAVDGSDVLGHVSDDGTTWRLRPLGGGLTAVFRYDESKLRRHPPGWDPGALPGGLPAQDAGPLDDLPAVAPDQSTGPAVVDVFVGYTARAATRMGSNPGLFVERAVARANEHFGNSLIADAVRLRLVGASLVSLAETGDIADALDGLRSPTDGIADGVHATRDRLGADLVHLLIDGTTPSGDGSVTCGVAYTAYRLSAYAFGVTAVQCEPTRGGSTFTHEVGHNFGADHDPANFTPPGTFPYARGFCDPNTRWATTMAYIGINNPCTRGIAFFSSPTVRHNGNPTGNAGADNARVLRATAAIVAAHREAASPETQAVTLPYVLPAGRGDGSHSLLRLANLGDASLAIAIRAYDDTGTAFGPVTATLGARTATQITSVKLESDGHPALDRTLGNGTGAWRLELTAPGAFEASALFRTADGFLVPLHAVAAADPGAPSGHVYRVPTANPASNTRKESSLRLANRAAGAAAVRITGFDDAGRASGEVSLSIPARAAFNLTVRELEAGRADTGGPSLTGSLTDGTGKWRLRVASDQPLAVVSLLKTATGSGSYLANLSDVAPVLPSVAEDPTGPGPGLTLGTPTVRPSSADPRQPVTLAVTVRNTGSSVVPRGTGTWYRSTDLTITSSDMAIDTTFIGPSAGLFPGQTASVSHSLNAPSSPGTYYYGLCLAGAQGSCSSAAQLTVVQVARVPDLVIREVELSLFRTIHSALWRAYVHNIGHADAPRATVRVKWRGRVMDTDNTLFITRPGRKSFVFGGWDGAGRIPAVGDTVELCVTAVQGERNTGNNCTTVRAPSSPFSRTTEQARAAYWARLMQMRQQAALERAAVGSRRGAVQVGGAE